MKESLILAVVVLYLSFITNGILGYECIRNEDDPYHIAAILENALANEPTSLRKLAGVFYSDQEKPPHSVRVLYTIQIPYNTNCSTVCTCWEKVCKTNDNVTCPEGFCCFEKLFLWARIPLLAHDDIYRTLEICPFIVGGLKEKEVSITLKLDNSVTANSHIHVNSNDFPCAWCDENAYSEQLIHNQHLSNTLDHAFTLRSDQSPLEIALITVTAKVSLKT